MKVDRVTPGRGPSGSQTRSAAGRPLPQLRGSHDHPPKGNGHGWSAERSNAQAQRAMSERGGEGVALDRATTPWRAIGKGPPEGRKRSQWRSQGVHRDTTTGKIKSRDPARNKKRDRSRRERAARDSQAGRADHSSLRALSAPPMRRVTIGRRREGRSSGQDPSTTQRCRVR